MGSTRNAMPTLRVSPWYWYSIIYQGDHRPGKAPRPARQKLFLSDKMQNSAGRLQLAAPYSFSEAKSGVGCRSGATGWSQDLMVGKRPRDKEIPCPTSAPKNMARRAGIHLKGRQIRSSSRFDNPIRGWDIAPRWTFGNAGGSWRDPWASS